MIKIERYKKLSIDPQEEPHLVYTYAVYDKAADFFNPPYCSQCQPEQERLNLRRAALNGQFQYPNDLVLYLVGIFDTNTGSFRESNTYEVGPLYIGDFARKEISNNENIPVQN